MQLGAKALQPFVGASAWATPESRIIPRLRADVEKPGIEIDLYDTTYHDEVFVIEPKTSTV